jgi:hypothetical protein
MASPRTPIDPRYRIPELEISKGVDISEQGINTFEDIFRKFLEIEHKKSLMPPSFLLDISKESESEIQKEIKILPTDDITVTLTGYPLALLTTYSCGMHGMTHMRQLSHLEVMRRYVEAELVIYALISILKTSISQGIESLVKSGIGKFEGSLAESSELRNLVVNMRRSLSYLPFTIDRDRIVLLESVPLLDQLLALEKPEVKEFGSLLKESVKNSVNKRIMKVLTDDPEKSLYLESIELASRLSEILPKSYLNLLLYASHFTGLGAQGVLSMASELAREESKVKVLAMVEKEAEGGGNRLELVFEYNIFDYEELVKHKENLLGIIDDALEICKKGRSFERLKYIRRKVDGIKAPSELQFLSDDFSCIIFSQSLAPNQPPAYYIHAGGSSCNRENVMLFSSFFADLIIAVNVLNALMDSLEKGGDLKKAVEGSIRCPFRRAPQMKCVWKTECEHEKTWFDAIYGT